MMSLGKELKQIVNINGSSGSVAGDYYPMVKNLEITIQVGSVPFYLFYFLCFVSSWYSAVVKIKCRSN